MIIYVDGDSFTNGHELWEEKNIPNYAEFTKKEMINWIQTDFPPNEESKRELTYTKLLQDNIGCKVINNGRTGSSQHEIMQRVFVNLQKLKKFYPAEELVCIIQNTGPNRVWIWNEQKNRTDSFIPHNLTSNFGFALGEATKLNIYAIHLRYITDYIYKSNFNSQILAVQNYCHIEGIKFMHFHMYENTYNFFDKFCINESMFSKLEKHYGDKAFILPGGHANCASHILIAEWLIDEMKKRNIL